jgi:hypothetical protein
MSTFEVPNKSVLCAFRKLNQIFMSLIQEISSSKSNRVSRDAAILNALSTFCGHCQLVQDRIGGCSGPRSDYFHRIGLTKAFDSALRCFPWFISSMPKVQLGHRTSDIGHRTLSGQSRKRQSIGQELQSIPPSKITPSSRHDSCTSVIAFPLLISY